MSIRIKDATPIDVLQDHLLFAVGNTEGDTDGCVSLGQVKDFTDADKATVAFTGSYLNLTDAPNLEAYVQMTTLQQNYYTRNQINQIIGGITGPKYVKVEELPEEGENNIIYLLPQEGGGEQNIFDEYVWLPDGLIYEKIGSTQADFDNYYTIDEVDALIPSVSNATITLQQGGVTKGTFTLNQSSNKTINLDESFVQEQADWDVEDPTAVDFIKNKPTIPTVNDPTITFTQGGVTKGTFTLNQSQAETIELGGSVQSDWEQEDNTEPDYIKNKPDTLSLMFTYDDHSTEIIDFYISNVEEIYDYFYIENTYEGENTITLTTTVINGSGSPPTGEYATSVEYSKDRLNWTTLNLLDDLTPGTQTKQIQLEAGDTVYLRNSSGGWDSYQYTVGPLQVRHTFDSSKNIKIGGKLVSLLDYTGTNIPNEGVFYRMFYGCTNLISTEYLKFENTISFDIRYMFSGCTSLVEGPSVVCGNNLLCEQMFSNCSSLTKAPNIQNRSGNNNGGTFEMMFWNCTSIINGPDLSMMVCSNSNDCASMFNGCTSLVNPPILPTMGTVVYGVFYYMFSGCTSLTTAPTLTATNMNRWCYSGMFYGCTALTTAPELKATTLAQGCYENMFYGCTALNDVTTYANNISASDCLKNWLNNVASTGTFHNLGSATYTTGVSGIPSGWTEVNS